MKEKSKVTMKYGLPLLASKWQREIILLVTYGRQCWEEEKQEFQNKLLCGTNANLFKKEREREREIR